MNTRNLTPSRELASDPVAGRAEPRQDVVRAPDARIVEVSRRALGRPRNVCLVGAGDIAATHVKILQGMREVRVVAVVDPDLAAARRLVDILGAGEVHDTPAAALAANLQLDAAHVMVPPPVRRDAALPLLEAGCAVLLEQPLGVSSAECDELLAAGRSSGATLGVNQNFVHHPALVRLRRALAEGTYGKPRFVDCIYNVALRQLAARQFGHWMFHEPGNLLLEQAVHPLSQIVAVAGAVKAVRAIAGAPTEVAPGVLLFPSLTATLDCAELPAQLRFAVGQSYPFWQLTVVCDDGVLVADILANRCYAHGRTRWSAAADGFGPGVRTAGAVFGDAVRNATRSSLRLQRPSNPFLRSTRGSVGAFYEALDGAAYETDGAFGAAVMAAVEAVRDAALGAPAPAAVHSGPKLAGRRTRASEIALLGGDSMIAARTVQRFLVEGKRVSVMVRSARNLPAELRDRRIGLHFGDVRDYEAVRRAIGAAKVVVNLADEDMATDGLDPPGALVGGAETAARICLALGVRRLVHVGGIAGLYLGPQPRPVTGATALDPAAWRRTGEARAHAECDRMLQEMHAREGLPVCILRRGLVVGDGRAALHRDIGVFNNDQHCIGWNLGRNPLPFVLAQDVVEAIVRAALTDKPVEGRCYNLVGDVRPSAQEYVRLLAAATGRPLRFHSRLPAAIWAGELTKWMLRRARGDDAPAPSRRDLLSRGLSAQFDCEDAKRDLGWVPAVDPRTFLQHAVAGYAP